VSVSIENRLSEYAALKKMLAGFRQKKRTVNVARFLSENKLRVSLCKKTALRLKKMKLRKHAEIMKLVLVVKELKKSLVK